MGQDELVPLKKVLGALGVSRATLWRASKSVASFPAPTLVGGRVYWRSNELGTLRDSLDAFRGRNAFEREQRFERLKAAKTNAAASRRSRSKLEGASVQQPDLFGWSTEG